MKLNRNLLYISPGFAADEKDTSCIPYLQDFFHALIKSVPSENVKIISLHYPFSIKTYEWHGIKVYPCGGANRGGFYKPMIWNRAYSYFRQIHREQAVDILHSFWFSECCYVGQKIAAKKKIPHVCTIVGQDSFQKNRYSNRINTSWLTMVAPTEFSKNLFLKRYPNSGCDIIPFGVDLDAIQMIPESSRTVDLLGVGSLIPLKSYDVFIGIMEQLCSVRKNLKAVIVGDGPERKNLEEMVRKKGLKDNILFKGNIQRTEVLEIMSQSRILLHPSSYETFGMVYAEALHSGMAIVSRANGCYFPSKKWLIADDVSSFAEQTAQILDAFPDENIDFDFDIRTSINKQIELYESLLSI